MIDTRQKNTKIDTKEFELPETLYVRDIENNVFQGIILQALSQIPDIALLEGSFIDNILGRVEGVKGITAEQDLKNHSVRVKVEVNVAYGVSIPEKAEEIQHKVAEDITKLTGLHVAEVHVVFKQLIPSQSVKRQAQEFSPKEAPQRKANSFAQEYTDIF